MRRLHSLLIPCLLAAAGATACGPMPGTAPREDPAPAEEPAAEAPETDDEQVHVIDLGREDIYYVVDARRRLCFLHEQDAVAQVDCEAIPEARELLGLDAPGPDRSEPPPSPDDTPNPEERERFRQAYAEIFCAKRLDEPVDPRDALSRAGLTEARYVAIEGWMATRDDRWRRFIAQVLESCPETSE